MSAKPIWIQDEKGLHSLEPTLPNCWQGQVDCIVGPFSSKGVAEYFAKASVEFAHCNSIMESIFARGDAWYVSVKPVEA